MLAAMWREDDGVLSFEWILLLTLLAIGVVGGLTGVRDAVIDELGDVAQAIVALDQSYVIDDPLAVNVHGRSNSGAANSGFVDGARYSDCGRRTIVPQQLPEFE